MQWQQLAFAGRWVRHTHPCSGSYQYQREDDHDETLFTREQRSCLFRKPDFDVKRHLLLGRSHWSRLCSTAVLYLKEEIQRGAPSEKYGACVCVCTYIVFDCSDLVKILIHLSHLEYLQCSNSESTIHYKIWLYKWGAFQVLPALFSNLRKRLLKPSPFRRHPMASVAHQPTKHPNIDTEITAGWAIVWQFTNNDKQSTTPNYDFKSKTGTSF